MKSLSQNLIAEKNKIHATDPWLILLDITLTDAEESAGPTIYRFVRNNEEDIIYGGNTYIDVPFILGWVTSNVDGEIPLVSLKISNVTRILTPYLNSLEGGLDSTVKITVVNNALLDEDYSELELDFTVIACTADAYWVSWSLGMANPANQRFPLYRYIANYCPYNFYNDGTGECGYNGALIDCGHTLNDCIAHGNEINFGGDLGMQNDGLRIA